MTHVTQRRGEKRCIQGYSKDKDRKRPLENLGARVRIILKWIFKKIVRGLD
jgi:hypothetical protein